MKKECTEEEARYKAEAYCAMAERCPAEVRRKLQQWGAPKDAIDGIVEKLLEDNYISEQRYVVAFVREKHRFNRWGTAKIAQALRMKQLPSSLIEDALQELDADEYLSALSALLLKKSKEVKARNDYERNGKLIRFALGRGYGMDDILDCLKKIGLGDGNLE